MGSIELVIAIDEKLYNKMKTYHGLDDTYMAVKKGIPLPEGAEILSKEEYSDLHMRAADRKEDKKQESCNDEEHNLQEPKMTRKELKAHCEKQIELCETWAYGKGEKPSGKIYEEHKLILELLEQESCDDAISRQWLMECVNEGWIKFDTEEDKNRFTHLVRDMAPPVTPQPKIGHWIPVSYRLPEENKTVIASTTYGVYPEAKYTEEYGWEWAYESGADYWKELVDKVEAWMPLPKRYEP